MKQTTSTSPPGPHDTNLDLITKLALIVLIAGALQLFWGAMSIGISTDEPTHIQRTQNWLNNGWYLPDRMLADGEPRTGFSVAKYAYGPAFAGIAHTINVVAGYETRATVSYSREAFTVRHLLVACIGLATALAVGAAVFILTNTWRFAIWSAAALLVIPLWTGMSFFNPKDVPAAAGYTMLTVGLVLALKRDPSRRTVWLQPIATAALVAIGVLLSAGTRSALWLPAAASLITFGVLMFIQAAGGHHDRGLHRVVIGVIAGTVIGALSIVALYPVAFVHPLDFLTQSLSESSKYPWRGVTLTAGQLLPQHPPAWYLPVWAFASVPVLIFLVGIYGGASAASSIIRSIAVAGRSSVEGLADSRDLATILVLQQALLLPLGSMAIDANMYSGFRQHLYVLPALAILAGVGAARIWQRWHKRHTASSFKRSATTVVLAASLLAPMAEGLLLFPYNYTYVNPIAGIGGINGRWETDFWWTSSREALLRIPRGNVPLCSWVDYSKEIPSRPKIRAADCEIFTQLSPYLTGQGLAADLANTRSESLWIIFRQRAGGTIPYDCLAYQSVTRWLRGERVVMAPVLQCDADLLAGAEAESG